MGMLDTILNVIDAPSNALQGLAVEGWEGAKKGLLQERNYDFEETFTDEFRKENPNASYWLSGAMNVIADPLNFVPLGMLTKGVKASKTAAGKPSGVAYVADKALAEMPNRLEYFGRGFYEGGPLNQRILGVTGFGEGLLKTANRELNPFMMKKNKIARDLGIPTTTLNVVDDVLKKVNDPQLQATIQNLSALKNPTKKQAKMIKDYNNLGKILQGQLGWNYLEKEAYGLASALGKYKNTHFLSEGLDLTKDNFVKGAKEFNNVIDEAYHLSDDVLGQVWDRVARNQQIADPSKHKLYFKTPAVSNATATRISNEAAGTQAKKRSAVQKLFEKGKPSPFKSVKELKQKLMELEYPEITMKGTVNPKRQVVMRKGIDSDIIKGKDGKEYLMFSESYLSSDNLLGGVNQVNLLSADGKIYSFVNDAQDIFNFKFPKGQTPIVVTPGLVGDFTKQAGSIKKSAYGEAQSQAGMMLGRGKAGSKSKPALSPQLKKAAEDIQRIQKEITLNPLDYLNYAGKVNLATSPYQD